jgi:hypothetical protein
MNTNNVVSQVVAADLSGKEHLLVKLTSTGINIAASTDRNIGTLMRGNVKPQEGVSAVGLACDVYLAKGGYVAYAVLGATTAAIAMGAGLIADSANPGKLIPSESSPIALAWQAITGADGSVMRVLFL